ncbi:MAG: asparagine synthase (glutamine-hydrolyzing) [Rhodoferax sp.]|nr:asparagine synthase (glutamine-hydrolyzing) [Rhodoferax sp.]
MCGIVGSSFDPTQSNPSLQSGIGLAAFQERHPFANLDGALSALAHRGPDDSGIFANPESGIWLGHRRLSILDPSSMAHQPMASDDGQVVLVFNGEIYNFRELRAGLEASGCKFRSDSDTEVLLQMYLRDGEAMLPSLNGIFALAIWDGRLKRMLLARDALGVKPLYYSESGGQFTFSSEIRALRMLLPAASALDHAALHRYMSFLYCPGEGTPFADVFKLDPGSALWVGNGKVEQKFTWYQLPAFRTLASGMSENEAVRGTEQYLRKAVHRQMVSDVPVGAFLSGGLDSSSIVAFAREINPDIHCFTIDSAGSRLEGIAEDLPYAKQVASHLKVPLSVVRVDPALIATDFEALVNQLDEPLADPAAFNVLYIARLARHQGIKVLLSGTGGDDLFTGYRRHRAVQYEQYWNWLPKAARTGLESVTRNLDQRRPLFRKLGKLFNGASLDSDARLVNYFAWARRDDLIAFYTPEFRATISDVTAASPMLQFLEALPESVGPLDRMLALEQRFFLADHNLNYTDKMSMAAGVETRVPFLDLDLVEFAGRVPINLKQRGLEGKWPLKKAMEPYLPREVIYRSKSGFGAPLRHWMRFELREMVGDLLSKESLSRRKLFEPVAVRKLIEANDCGRIDGSYTLLSMLCIEMYLRNAEKVMKNVDNS